MLDFLYFELQDKNVEFVARLFRRADFNGQTFGKRQRIDMLHL